MTSTTLNGTEYTREKFQPYNYPEVLIQMADDLIAEANNLKAQVEAAVPLGDFQQTGTTLAMPSGVDRLVPSGETYNRPGLLVKGSNVGIGMKDGAVEFTANISNGGYRLQKSGGKVMDIHSNGDIEFMHNSVPMMTLYPNGRMEVVGAVQAAGVQLTPISTAQRDSLEAEGQLGPGAIIYLDTGTFQKRTATGWEPL